MEMIVQALAVGHNRSLHSRMIKGPSSNSDTHSTVPEAVAIAWLSAASVLLTARGIL
jgi:hypothetical protein